MYRPGSKFVAEDLFKGHFPDRVLSQNPSGKLTALSDVIRKMSVLVANDGWLDDRDRSTLRDATLRVKDDDAAPWIYSVAFSASNPEQFLYQVTPEFFLPLYDEAFGKRGIEPLAGLLLERPLLRGMPGHQVRLGDAGATSLYQWLVDTASDEEDALVARVMANVLEVHHLTSWLAVEWFQIHREHIGFAAAKLSSEIQSGRRRAAQSIEAACAIEYLGTLNEAAAAEKKKKVRIEMQRAANTLRLLTVPTNDMEYELERLDSLALEPRDAIANEIVSDLKLQWASANPLSNATAIWFVSRLGLLGPDRIDPIVKPLVDALDSTSREGLADLVAIGYKNGAHGRVLLDLEAERVVVVEAMKSKTPAKRRGPVSALARSRGPVANLWLFHEASRGVTYRRRERARALIDGVDSELPVLCDVTRPLAIGMLQGFMNASVPFSPADWVERFSVWSSILTGLIFITDEGFQLFDDIGTSKSSSTRIAHPAEILPAEHKALKKALKEGGVAKQPFKQLRKVQTDSPVLPIRKEAKLMAGRLRRLGYVLGPEFDLGASTVAMRSLSTRYDIVLGPVGLRIFGQQIDGVESTIEHVKVYRVSSGSPSWAMLGEEGRYQEQKAIPRSEWPASVASAIAEDLHALAK